MKDAPLKGETAIYNLKNNDDETPLFVGDKNVQMVLMNSGLKHLELTKPDSTTLLWSFTKERYDTVSLNIIDALRHQVNQRVTTVEDYSVYREGRVKVERTPVFAAEHARIVREYLEAAKRLEIQLDTVMEDGFTLLHHCFKKNIMARGTSDGYGKYLLDELGHQRHMTYKGMTPVLSTDRMKVESVEMYVRSVYMDDSEKIALYQHCLNKRMLRSIIAEKLCLALPNINSRRLSYVTDY